MGQTSRPGDNRENSVHPSESTERWLSAVAVVGAAGLIGFGIVLWIAANWDDLGKAGRFGLVSGIIALSALLAAAAGPARAAASLVGVLGIGGLLALTGQTYQTGADPWQLFALWAALALPWAVAARHDAVWSLWVAVVFTALPLWVISLTGRYAHDLTTTAVEWLAAAAVCLSLSGNIGAERWLGRTPWAFRLAVLSSLTLVTGAGLEAQFGGSSSSLLVYVAGLIVVASIAAVLAVRSPFDLPLLAAATLALDVMAICGLVRAVLWRNEHFGSMLLVGVISAGVVAASAVALLRIARARQDAQVSHAAAPLEDAAAHPPEEASRTWPVAVLSGIGAIMAALPLIGFLFMALGRAIERGPGTWITGLVVLGAAVALLRTAKPLGFGQQFGVIALAVGGLLIGFGAYRDLPIVPATLIMLSLTCVLAALLPVNWIRGLLGAAAAGFACVLIAQTFDDLRHMPDVAAFRLAWTLIAAAGAAALLKTPRAHDGITAFAIGWSALALLGLMLAAGQSFLVGTRFGLGGSTLGTAVGAADLWNVNRVLSIAAALGGAWLLLERDQGLRGPAGYGVAAVAVILAAFMPGLGAVILLLAAATLTGRRTIAVLAAIVALWIVGAFYYWLGWPLVQKAYLLIGLGVALAALCWLSGIRTHAPTFGDDGSAPLPTGLPTGLAAGLIGVAAVTTAMLVGSGVRDMERILTTGRIVHIPLAPVDPRSLMQGDYMALRFALPATPDAQHALRAASPRLAALATLDPRGVATVEGFTSEPLAPRSDRLLIDLAWRAGRWSLGTDAFYFKEGTASRYAQARFGTFRIDENGRALLSGLADADLNPLH